MTNEEWQAIISCNAQYDPQFFYALITTGTFCRPSCTSRTPNPKNVVLFYDQERALSSGFRPCQRCRPNEASWEGAKKDLFEKTKDYIHSHYELKITLQSMAEILERNSSHIQRTFKELLGISPLQYLHDVRIERAKNLLRIQELSTTQIAYEIGYSSLSHFSKVFKAKVGLSPKIYREAYALEVNIHS
ncbi:bifunctional transcriptional activator/DNA repair enzyme AdaA [Paenibacillus sp. 1P07SE]|uniref:bifunctional transcriptional activator/DNA repair enzyme AdaA n=1 Tax=Paenibacillus sp. 1P07SE TaxID=3132209 RepID=UPI0039A536C7